MSELKEGRKGSTTEKYLLQRYRWIDRIEDDGKWSQHQEVSERNEVRVGIENLVEEVGVSLQVLGDLRWITGFKYWTRKEDKE